MMDKTSNRQISEFGNDYLFTGRRFDGRTGVQYFRNRHYNVQNGRFLSRDPLRYSDGKNLYPYVKNIPTTWTDPMGLLTWVNNPTVTDDTGIVKSPLGMWGRGSLAAAGLLATTLPRATISYSCCCKGWLNWALCTTGISITFHVEIVLLPAYVSPAQAAWVLRAEKDHEADYITWANGPGKAVATKTETLLLAKSYWTSESCGSDVRMTMTAALLKSVKIAIKASKAAHDTPGKHTWGGPNRRP